ncbi:MAG TPA: Cys-tRNA(Pro) deacylase, partial [Nocardioides sp.]|nr:Cys-tRNA(Pro) deacylase [Nocardioides sp.]
MTPAVIALRAAGVAFTVHEYAHDPRAQEKGQS